MIIEHRIFIFAASFFLILSNAWSQTKIAYVDMKQLLDKAPQVVTGRKKLDEEFRARNEKIITDEQKLQELEETLRKDAPILSASYKADLERQIRSLQRNITRSKEDLQDEFNIRLNEEYIAVQQQLEQAVRMLAKAKGYDLVISNPVLFASETVDITDVVLAKLKQLFVQDGY